MQQHIGDSRLFAFGVGGEADRALVRGIARAGHGTYLPLPFVPIFSLSLSPLCKDANVLTGTAEFVASGTRIEGVVMSLLRRAMQPVLKSVRVDWGSLSPHLIPSALPSGLPPFLFSGQKVLAYTYLVPGAQYATS